MRHITIVVVLALGLAHPVGAYRDEMAQHKLFRQWAQECQTQNLREAALAWSQGSANAEVGLSVRSFMQCVEPDRAR